MNDTDGNIRERGGCGRQTKNGALMGYVKSGCGKLVKT